MSFRKMIVTFRYMLVCCLAALLLAPSAFGLTYYTIEVSVKDEAGAAISGVTFTVDGKAVTATLNTSKNYVIKNMVVGEHFVKPAKSGWTFVGPESLVDLPTSGQSYSPNGKLSFTGRGVYAIRGQAYRLLADGSRQGLRNFSVTRSGSSTPMTTDIDGNFAFTNLPPGSYTLTPRQNGFTCSPATLAVTLPTIGQSVSPDAQVSFAAAGIYKITGSVKTSSGSALKDVKVMCVGSDAYGGNDIPCVTATTDSYGKYTLGALPPGVYTVTPVSHSKAFTPASKAITLPVPSGTSGAPNGIADFKSTSSSDPSALLPLTYYLVKDSNGTAPAKGASVMLIFEPNGVADLYVAFDSDAIAYKGTYAYSSGKLTLSFNYPDPDPDYSFVRSASFSFDPSKSSITIPFKVFSSGSGSSSWTRKSTSVIHNLSMIFASATLSDDLKFDQAMARVMAYAQAIILKQAISKPEAATTTVPKLKLVKPLANGVRLVFDKGPEHDLIFFSWSNSKGDAITQYSPQFLDPRINLDVEPADQDFDPYNRTALLLSPFYARHNLAWYDWTFYRRQSGSLVSERTFHYAMEADDNITGMKPRLEKARYKVVHLKDEETSVTRIIDNLLTSPGFVYFSTHGSSDGTLATGIYLGDSKTDSDATILNNFASYYARCAASARYRDILNYKATPEGNLTTLRMVDIMRNMRGTSVFVGMTPVLWEAVQKQGGASFSSSLVYISACEADQSAALREAVKARSFLGFSVDVTSDFAGAVFQYLCRHLSRRTHSAEEAYYNIVRLATTRLMVYTEDRLLSTTLPKFENSSTSKNLIQIKDVFRGYGYGLGVNKVTAYQGNGWMTMNRKDFNPGVIWWQLFSARWGGDAQDSRSSIYNVCWTPYWRKGKTGGLAAPGCQNMTSGRAPWPAEFSYVMYLLTGQPLAFECPKLLPRWTLNDKQ